MCDLVTMINISLSSPSSWQQYITEIFLDCCKQPHQGDRGNPEISQSFIFQITNRLTGKAEPSIWQNLLAMLTRAVDLHDKMIFEV